MELEQAIRSRRTHKAFGAEPVERGMLEELLDLSRWAPNHGLTNPWRFRVIGPQARERLKDAAGEVAAAKLDRAPTLVVVSVRRGPDPVQELEDVCATACAAYIVLLAAHGRGLAGYWRTPEVLRTAEGTEALGVPMSELVVGLLHLGPPRQDREAPPREPLADVVEWLD